MKRRTSANAAVRTADDTEPDFDLTAFLPYQLAIAATRVSRLYARHYAERFGISIPEWRVLAVVGREPGISPSAVSERTMMDKVKVSRAAAALVSRGLAKQAADPGDGRARMLRLTRRGQGILRSMVPLAQELEDAIAKGMTRSDWNGLRAAIAQINTSVPDGSAIEEH